MGFIKFNLSEKNEDGVGWIYIRPEDVRYINVCVDGTVLRTIDGWWFTVESASEIIDKLNNEV